jgi:hypothetical protein
MMLEKLMPKINEATDRDLKTSADWLEARR